MDPFKEDIRKHLLDLGIVEPDLLIPPDSSMGDIAFPCFNEAKKRGKSPVDVAKELCEQFGKSSLFERISAAGPYLNFFISRGELAKYVLSSVSSGEIREPVQKELVMIEFSQANTHKAFHVGHLRGTSLGEALSRVLRKAGYEVIQANYQGDTGAHVAKWLWCYKAFHDGEEPQGDAESWIADIYVESVRRLAEDPLLQAQVDEINRLLERRSDEDLNCLWKKTRQWSLDALEVIYKDLDVNFDSYFFEGEMEERAKEIVGELVKKGIAKVDNGATIIEFEDAGLGVWVLLRKDGTTLYSAKDLALAEQKFDTFMINRNIYVVGAAQSMHFRQLFQALEMMGFDNLRRCEHLAYAEVRFPHGKMSSRTGDNVLFADLRKEVIDHASSEVRRRHADWSEEEISESARNIGIAAMKFGMISQDPFKNIIFDITKACDFEGETGPYVQYAHARICSILRKADEQDEADFSLLVEEEEKMLLVHMLGFPGLIAEIAESLKVNMLCSYLIRLAQLFNEYYHKHKVLGNDQKMQAARLALISGVKGIIAEGLDLLAISAPSRM